MKNIKDNRMRKVNYSLQNKLKYRKKVYSKNSKND